MAGGAQAVLPAGARIRIAGRRLAALCVVGLILVALYMLWFRDSSLVAVKTVKVEGVRGSGDERLEKALTAAARRMTTLHMRPELLANAARQFPLVEAVSAEASFPSTLTVHVTEHRPASLIGDGSDAVAVSADGTILRGLPAADLRLPHLPLSTAPKRDRLGGPILEQAQLLGAVPKVLRPYVDHTFNGSAGVGVTLSGGVQLSFGDATRAADKWRAAAAVLSDPDLGPLDYVDLSVPGRPAVGGASHSPPPLGSG